MRLPFSCDHGLIIKGSKDLEELFKEIVEWKKKARGLPAKLGDLVSVDLEEEFAWRYSWTPAS